MLEKTKELKEAFNTRLEAYKDKLNERDI